jgi:hypothetical protein
LHHYIWRIRIGRAVFFPHPDLAADQLSRATYTKAEFAGSTLRLCDLRAALARIGCDDAAEEANEIVTDAPRDSGPPGLFLGPKKNVLL